MKGLGKAGFDTSNMSQAMQDAVWSTSVQFGAGSEKKGNGAIGMFKKAFAGKDYNSMSDEDRIKTLQDYKLANNDKMFASSSENVRAGTAKRAADEKKSLLALAGQDASSSPATVNTPATKKAVAASDPSASASVSPVTPKAVVAMSPRLAPPPPPKPAPAMPDVKVEQPVSVAVSPSSTGAAAGLAAGGVSQHLSNQTIAHIVTGGIGFRG